MRKKLQKILTMTVIATQLMFVSVSAKEMRSYILDFDTIKKTDMAYQGKDRMYYFLDAEINKGLDPIVKKFKPQGKTDYEKLKSVGNFIKGLGLTYSSSSDYNSNHQIENIKNGHTMCLGITVLGSKLLDKTSIEYRYVLQQNKYISNPKGSPVDAGHITLEIKTDKGNWMEMDFTHLLYTQKYDYIETFLQDDIYIADKRQSVEIPNRRFGRKDTSQNGIYQEIIISPTYKQGKRIDNKLQLINNL